MYLRKQILVFVVCCAEARDVHTLSRVLVFYEETPSIERYFLYEPEAIYTDNKGYKKGCLLARRIPSLYLRYQASTGFLKQGTSLCSSQHSLLSPDSATQALLPF
jgi:hypothetical protein